MKLGVSEEELISLNPELTEKGLIAGMILRLPKRESHEFKIEDNLIVEKVNLRDSLFRQNKLKVALMAPFRLPTVPIDSIKQTNQILQNETCKNNLVGFLCRGEISHGRFD